MGLIAGGLGVAVVAVGAMLGAVVALGEKGSNVNDVTSGFDRLSGSVENADKILAAMTKGVAGTIDDLTLMTDANKLMAAGVKGNADTFGTLTEAARVLSKEGFGPIPTILDQINRAEMTGNATRLGRIGLTVDAKTAEKNYAASLGVTADQLTPAQLLEAKREAILISATATVKAAGEQQL